MKNHTKYSALITSSLLIVATFAGPANATEPVRESSTLEVQPTTISADSAATLSFTKSSVQTTPAVKADVAPLYTPVTDQNITTPSVPTSDAPAAQRYATQPVKAPSEAKSAETPSPTPTPAPVVSASGKGASIAAAAYAQLGVHQDCTALVTNALAAVGVHFHGWPADYLKLGRTISATEAQPGDLAFYANGGTGMAHIAVYVGGGKAVHGGWNGGTTSLQSVNVGSGPVFIRVA